MSLLLIALARADTAHPPCRDDLVATAPADGATQVPVDVLPAIEFTWGCDWSFPTTLSTGGEVVAQTTLELNEHPFARLELAEELLPQTAYTLVVSGDELGSREIRFTTGTGRVSGAPGSPSIASASVVQPLCDDGIGRIADRPEISVVVRPALDPSHLSAVEVEIPSLSDNLHGPYLVGELSRRAVDIGSAGRGSFEPGEELCFLVHQYDGRGVESGVSESFCTTAVERLQPCPSHGGDSGPWDDGGSRLGCGGCSGAAGGAPAWWGLLGLGLLRRRRGRGTAEGRGRFDGCSSSSSPARSPPP